MALPEEVMLRSFQLLQPLCSHAALCATSRGMRDMALDDNLWSQRLALDFPLAAPSNVPGQMYRTYRMLAKSQLNSARRRFGIGVISKYGYSQSICLDDVAPSNTATRELKLLAARFAEMNTDIEAVVPVRHSVAVLAAPSRRHPVISRPNQQPATNQPAAHPPVSHAALMEQIRSRRPMSPEPQAPVNRAALMEQIRTRRPSSPSRPAMPQPGSHTSLLEQIRSVGTRRFERSVNEDA